MHNPKEQSMAIERVMMREVARVEAEDDGAVSLRQRHRVEFYTPDEAHVLGNELIAAAREANRFRNEEAARRASAIIRNDAGEAVL